MSAPLHERVLPLPKVWGRKRVRVIDPPAIPKVLSGEMRGTLGHDEITRAGKK